MPIATNDSYSVGSGVTIYAGRTAPSTLPAWLAGKPLNQWFSIPSTAGPGAGLNTNAYSDLTIRPSDSSLFAVASGGHTDGSSNGAAQITLSADTPAWTTLRTSSTPTADVLYYADGRPTSRHTYHHTHYIASLDAVLLAGCRFGYGATTPTGPGMDLFSLALSDYSARYTFPDITNIGTMGYGVAQDGSGNIWTQTGHKFTVSTQTWSKPGTGQLLRYPNAYDSLRDRIFALLFNDGEGSGTAGVQAQDLNPSTGNSQTITFNSSAALTQFVSDAPAYAGMAFCPLNGKYYFLHPGRIGTFYVVTPNSGTVWDIDLLTPGGETVTSSGVLCKRLLWVPALNGFVLQSQQSQNIKFLRMA